ncbi:hypothetical protein PVAP13_5KG402607 [Panicum virgatum]|uniref:Uncharacterized protein n=1 Tax=Panicum virgatum TaxID=38727 RepID=A0A8T0SNL9_PANVG|nr:hypothetical protein PVAP13_5KG402607 [Panicum virgatum]
MNQAIMPRPPSCPPEPALCESAGGGAGSDLRGGRSGSTGPHGQKAGPARSSTNGGQVPRRRHHHGHPSFPGACSGSSRTAKAREGAGGVGEESSRSGVEKSGRINLDTTTSIRLVCFRLILIYSLTEYRILLN